MSQTDHLIALLDEGNPIPRPDDLVRERDDAATYLATLPPRSSEMTQLKDKTKTGDHRRSAMPWLVAAVAVVVAGVAMILVGQNDKGPTPATTPTTIVETTPTTVVTPTTVPTTIDAAEAAWEAIPLCCSGDSGQFRVSFFTPEFSIDLPEGWIVDHTRYEGFMPLIPFGSDPNVDPLGISFFRLDDKTVQGQIDRFSDTETFDTTGQETVSVGGASGSRFQVAAKERVTLIAIPQYGQLGMPAGLEHIIYLLDVDGATVMIAAQAGTPAESQIDGIVESIVWKDLG